MSEKPEASLGNEQAGKPALSARERMAKGWANLRPSKPGDPSMNPEGKNGRRRHEIVAAILEEPEDWEKAIEPGSSRIRNVVLAMVRDAQSGGPGAGQAGKVLVEQYAGKAKQQVELSGAVSGSRVVMYLPAKGGAEIKQEAAEPVSTDGGADERPDNA